MNLYLVAAIPLSLLAYCAFAVLRYWRWQERDLQLCLYCDWDCQPDISRSGEQFCPICYTQHPSAAQPDSSPRFGGKLGPLTYANLKSRSTSPARTAESRLCH